ncbi:MAG: type II secretion system protein GspK [bacterium]|nr:type II secretion system protein GspK [bacterium]
MLIATLWTLAAMAVLAAYIDSVASADMERAAAAEAALERELARRSTEETLAYFLVTGRMNHRGLMIEPEQSFSDVEGNRGPDRSVGVIAVSGETYAGIGGMRFSVQDENGLAPVNFPSSRSFVAALSHVGVASADIERIIPRVEDYVDMDDDLSLSGAERFDYDQAALAAGLGTSGRDSATSRQRDRAPHAARTPGPDTRALDRSGATSGIPPELMLPHPSNWTMATPLELRRVLGINELIGPDQWRRLLPMLTVRQTSGYNFNTMRPDVLAAILEIEPEAVDNIRTERAQRSVATLNRIAMLTGTHPDIDEMDLRVLPSRFLRVSIWHNAGGLRSVAGMALTPYGDAPWRIDYRYKEPMARTGPAAPRQAPEPARTRPEPTGTHRDPTEPAIANESSDVGVLQPATPLLQ